MHVSTHITLYNAATHWLFTVDSLASEDDLARYVAESRREPPADGFDAAAALDVDDGGWKRAADATPFGLAECAGRYAFQTFAWRDAALVVVHPTAVYRTNDSLLLDAQRAIREGRVDDAELSHAHPRAQHTRHQRSVRAHLCRFFSRARPYNVLILLTKNT